MISTGKTIAMSLQAVVSIAVKKVFVIVKKVFAIVKMVFVVVKKVFVIVKKVFVIVKKVFVIEKKVFVVVKKVFAIEKMVLVIKKMVFCHREDLPVREDYGLNDRSKLRQSGSRAHRTELRQSSWFFLEPTRLVIDSGIRPQIQPATRNRTVFALRTSSQAL